MSFIYLIIYPLDVTNLGQSFQQYKSNNILVVSLHMRRFFEKEGLRFQTLAV